MMSLTHKAGPAAHSPLNLTQTRAKPTPDYVSQSFNYGLKALQTYCATFGNADVLVRYVVGDLRLGRWVAHQRTKYEKGSLTQEQIDQLESLPGWLWHAWDRGWDEGMSCLKEFIEVNGHGRVPKVYVHDRSQDIGADGRALDPFPLGNWLFCQRRRYSRGTLPAKRQGELGAIPDALTDWSASASLESWGNMISALHRYVSAHQSSDVPRSFTDNGLKLGIWVNRMRTLRNCGRLNEDRKKELESIPYWRWAEKRQKAES